jgi:iron complex outermembrane recepter protein
VSQGYRAGQILDTPECIPNQPVTRPCLLPDEIVLKPDTTTNYEVGMRSTWLDKRLTLNGALYYVKWKDLRIRGLSKLGFDALTNGSSAVSKGVELQFQAQLPYRLSLLGQYTFTDAQMTAPATLGGINAQDGDRLPQSPRHMGGLSLQYLRNLPGDYSFDASYGISARSNWFSTVALRQNGEILPGYTTQNASVGLSRNNWNVSLFVENLTNKYAFTGVENNPTFAGTIDGILTRNYFHSVLRPREFGLEVRMTF